MIGLKQVVIEVFDCKILVWQYFDWFVIGIVWQQVDVVFGDFQQFDGDFVIDLGYYDLFGMGVVGVVYVDQVVVEDVFVDY